MPTIAEMLESCPQAAPCPPMPPLSVCGHRAIDVTLMAVALDAETNVRIECGEKIIDRSIESCAMVSAYNERDTLVSAVVERSYPLSGCAPVPEPSITTGLQLGVILLVVLLWRRARRS